MNTARAANTNVLLITTSMSKSRYLRTENPIASGMSPNVKSARSWSPISHFGFGDPITAERGSTTR